MDPSPIVNARTFLRRGAVAFANLLADLPGERPPWVRYDLTGSYPLRTRPRRLTTFPPDVGPREPSVEEVTSHFEALGRAPWCRGVILKFGPTAIGPGSATALRRAVHDLRAAGKRTISYLAYPSLWAYFVACAADEVAIPEAAAPGPWGLGVEQLYLGAALQRAGAGFDAVRIGAYKTALEQAERETMSGPHREQVEAYLRDVEAAIVQALATSRGRSSTDVRSWLDRPPIGATEARERGLVDAIRYGDALVDDRVATFRETARFLKRRVPARGARVAVVGLEGTIVPGESRRSPLPLPLFGAAFAGSETVIRALRTAGRDATTEAVVLVVDSGGGSALASDLIWWEVARIAKAKPVVAVMGDVAASGGYYVVAAATRIVAAPTTLTGSIGVVSGKLVLRDAFARHGVRPEQVLLHRLAGLFSSSEPFDDEQRAWLRDSMDATYALFTRRVAEGRGLTADRVDAVGRGRWWSGSAAREHGLVDHVGDVGAAIAMAKQLAGLPGPADVWNVSPPRTLPPARDLEGTLHAVRALASEPCLLLAPSTGDVRGRR